MTSKQRKIKARNTETSPLTTGPLHSNIEEFISFALEVDAADAPDGEGVLQEQFMRDFLPALINSREKRYQFCIRLQDLAEWLDIREASLLRTLQRNYMQDQDYVVLVPQKLNMVGLKMIRG